MKRFYIAVVVMLGMLAISIIALMDLYHTKNDLLEQVDQMIVSVERKDLPAIQEQADAFHQHWHEEEHHLLRYIRHDQLDTLTSLIARLPSLAYYADLPEFSASLDQIRVLIEHLWESEVPNTINLF